MPTYYILTSKNWVYETQEEVIDFKKWSEPSIFAEWKANWTFHWLFWRKDFCDIWKDFYNNKITRDEMNILFDNIKK